MKAPDFDYVKPRTLDEAIEILSSNAESAQPLAGGQSLLASLNMRLSSPSLLVDISGLDELQGIRLDSDEICIGALTRHVDLIRSELIATDLPLVHEAIHFVAHSGIRNRGTIGGSLALGDPSAELPACMLALDADLTLASRSGRRTLAARDFYKGLFDTDLKPGELIVEIRIALAKRGTHWAFTEISRRRGDFAMVGIAAVADLLDGRVAQAKLVYFGCSSYPRVAEHVSKGLRNGTLPPSDVSWIEDAIAMDIEPTDAAGLSAETKLHLAKVMTRRLLLGAWSTVQSQRRGG